MRAHSLSADEVETLKRCLQVCYAIPFISDVEGFVWEAVFQHVKGLPVPDQIEGERTKRLFDAVDPATKTGWSLKTLLWKLDSERRFELVIQRADVMKKRAQLGFPKLTLDSRPQEIGNAIIQHWHDKITVDSDAQGVDDARIAILMKSADRKTFSYLESDLEPPAADDLTWMWSSGEKTALWGQRNGTTIYRWYVNGKQLFESFSIPKNQPTFTIARQRIDPVPLLDLILEKLVPSK